MFTYEQAQVVMASGDRVRRSSWSEKDPAWLRAMPGDSALLVTEALMIYEPTDEDLSSSDWTEIS